MKGWNVVKLGEIAFITSSKRIFAKEYQSKGIPFYRGKEIIEKHNGNEVSTELYISRERYEEIKNKFDVPRKGDILLSSVGTLGVSWFVDEDEFEIIDELCSEIDRLKEELDDQKEYYENQIKDYYNRKSPYEIYGMNEDMFH